MLRNDPVTLDDNELALTGEELGVDSGIEQIVVRPDGYYWQAPDGRQEVGPFESIELALADMDLADGEFQEPGETLQEAEDELGMATWIDPETGEPAEGQSRPRLDEM